VGRVAGRLSLTTAARDTIRRHAMLAGGERVLVAVSGGADSVALLHVLRALAPDFALTLHVAHVDHRLRADSADDAAFVTRLGAQLGVPVTVVAVDVPGGGSREEAARRVRYAALERVAIDIGASRIAVGHTADDQAETVVMRLLEGAGARGLAGIPAVRGRIVRPLLETRRTAILDALHALDQEWREDPSNTDRRFVRNRVRLDVLPRLVATSPGARDALWRTARLARETVDALEAAAAAALARLAVPEANAVTLPLAELRTLPRSLAAEVLRQAAAGPGRRTPWRAWAHRGLARVLADPPPRRAFRLGSVRVDVGSGRVRIGGAASARIASRDVVVPGVTELPEIDRALVARYVDADGYVVSAQASIVAFDGDRLALPLSVRARRRGDRFASFGGADGRLKSVLIAAKIPRWRRDALPLVESAGAIVWIAGVRRGAVAPVVAATRRVLEIAIVPLAEVQTGR
jgi:tRNA(Ile)-lysidine synthase